MNRPSACCDRQATRGWRCEGGEVCAVAHTAVVAPGPKVHAQLSRLCYTFGSLRLTRTSFELWTLRRMDPG
eukprot:2229134-Rhodomonas_salina.1